MAQFSEKEEHLRITVSKIHKVIKHTLATAGIVTLLSSCSYPLGAIKPEQAVPFKISEEWKPTEKEIRKVQRVPLPFQETENPFFDNTTLGELINYALAHNPDTQLAWAQTRTAASEFGLSRKEFFPTIDVGGNFTGARQAYTITSDLITEQYVSTWTAEAAASFTLFDFGSRYSNTESALQALFATAWTYNQELQNTIQMVTNDYYDYLYQEANQHADEQNVRDAKIIYEAAEKKIEHRSKRRIGCFTSQDSIITKSGGVGNAKTSSNYLFCSISL